MKNKYVIEGVVFKENLHHPEVENNHHWESVREVLFEDTPEEFCEWLSRLPEHYAFLLMECTPLNPYEKERAFSDCD